MSRDLSPVIAAQVMLAHGIGDDIVSAHVAFMWPLNAVDAGAPVAAAHVLLRRLPKTTNE